MTCSDAWAILTQLAIWDWYMIVSISHSLTFTPIQKGHIYSHYAIKTTQITLDYPVRPINTFGTRGESSRRKALVLMRRLIQIYSVCLFV